ncbi:MAG: hypothetical protein ACJAWZ_004062 [Paracoccaceae bacterium]|jgi:hypothetical protein
MPAPVEIIEEPRQVRLQGFQVAIAASPEIIVEGHRRQMVAAQVVPAFGRARGIGVDQAGGQALRRWMTVEQENALHVRAYP